MAPEPPTPAPPLSAAAEETLEAFERSIRAGHGPPGDPLRWLSALLDEGPDALRASFGGPQVDALRETLGKARADGSQCQPISKEEIATQARLRAGKEGRFIASSEDVVWAVLALVVERTQAARESPRRASPAEAIVELGLDGDTDPDSSDGDLLPASMATEEMLESLCSNLGIGRGGSAGVLRWLDVLLSHHEVVVDGEGGDKRLRRLKEWADLRAASGIPSPTLSSQEVGAAAAQNAQEAGQPLVTPQNVEIAIVKLTVAAFTEAKDEPSTAAEPPEPSPERSSPLKEVEPPEAGPDVAHRETEIEKAAEVPDAPSEFVSRDPQRTRTFRLFVSSTFADLQAERNVLQEIAFPRLRDFCAKHGARFQAIDLRWGVSEEAGVDQQTMNICLGEIERCHQVTPKPNFLVLLGDRYGWIPPPAQIPADEFETILDRVSPPEERERLERWYRKDLNADPPEYRLQPRSGEREAYRPWKAWEPEERGLRETFGRAVGEAGLKLPPQRLSLYQASATEQEVLAGALEVDDPTDKVFCFFREIRDPPEGEGGTLPAEAGDFVSANPEEAKQLRSLKTRLHERLPESCILRREVNWGDQGPKLTEAYLVDLAEWVADSLEQAILRELEHPAADLHPEIMLPEALRPDPTLTAEVAEHLLFAEERRRFFVGREDILEEIAEYTRGDDRNPLAIVGEGGAGKSALMAEAARRIGNGRSNGTLVVRFVGATPGSSDGRILLDSLCREIALQYGREPGELPNEYNELVPKLAEQLELATRDQPLVLIVDSLDQLAQPALGLTWIPSPLPPDVRLVVSSRPDEVGARLKSRGAAVLELGPLRRADGEGLLKAWLASAKPPRRLQPLQQEAVLDAFLEAEGNPLYLKLAAEEARRWPSWAVIGTDSGTQAPVMPLAKGVRGIIRENLLARLAQDDSHGWTLVSRAMGYLSASRFGLAEDELIQLLSRDPEVYASFLQGAEHMPQDLVDRSSNHWGAARPESLEADFPVDKEEASVSRLNELRKDPERLRTFLTEELGLNGLQLPVVLWSRLFFDLEPYLTERRAEGGSLLSFYHRELGDVAAEKFLAKSAVGDHPGPLAEEEPTGEPAQDAPHGRIAETEIHGRLADYFRSQADPDRERVWNGEGVRGLSELPYHLTHASRWEDVYETLTDFAFLEQKAAKVGIVERAGSGGGKGTLYTGVFQLQDDFDRALRIMPGGDDRKTGEHPLIVTAVDFGDGLVVRCPWCNTLHPLIQDWLGEEINCPNQKCGGPLKVNSFTVGNPFGGHASAEEP